MTTRKMMTTTELTIVLIWLKSLSSNLSMEQVARFVIFNLLMEEHDGSRALTYQIHLFGIFNSRHD